MSNGAIKLGKAGLFAAVLPISLMLPATAACSQQPQGQAGQGQASTQTPAQGQQAQGQGQSGAQQGPWRGLTVPAYPNASDVRIEADDDEYEIHFRSADQVQAVFDHYRRYLEGQGFRVTATSSSQSTAAANSTARQGAATASEAKRGADMVRGQGGAANSVELDVSQRGDMYKVEIEFDG